MLGVIIKKEIISHLITFRFFVGLILFVSLIVIFSTILIDDYLQKLENYDDLVARNESENREN